MLGASLLVLLGLASLAGKLGDVTSNATVDSLPASSESRALLRASEAFPSSNVLPAVVVYRRDSGLRAVDRAAIARDKVQLERAGLDLVGTCRGPARVGGRQGGAALRAARRSPTIRSRSPTR